MGCGEQRWGRRRSQDALAPGPAPRPRGEERRQLGPAGAPLPNSWPRPGGLREQRGGDVGRGLQGARPSPASSLPGAGRRGWPRKGGAPGRAAGGPRGAPRTKGDGDGSSVVKTTCAGGGPRPGRGLGAFHFNPFAAAASFLRLFGGQEVPALPGSGRDAGSRLRPSGGGTGPRHAGSRLPSSPQHLAPPPCPAPFPTWIPGRLANSLLREAGRGAGHSSDLIAPADVFILHLPCCYAFTGGALRTLQAGERGASSRRARAQVWRDLRHTPPRGLYSLRAPTPPLIPSAQNLSRHPPRPRHKLLLHLTLGPGKTCTGPRTHTPTRSGGQSGTQTPAQDWRGCHWCASSHLPCKPGPGQDLSCTEVGWGGRAACCLGTTPPSPFGRKGAYSRVPEG